MARKRWKEREFVVRLKAGHNRFPVELLPEKKKWSTASVLDCQGHGSQGTRNGDEKLAVSVPPVYLYRCERFALWNAFRLGEV